MVDVFLDRRLTRDDNRGVGQGVTDNHEILSTFKLIFEPRSTVCVYLSCSSISFSYS